MSKRIVLFFLVFTIIFSVQVSAEMNLDFSDEESCVVAPHTFRVEILNNQTFTDFFHVNVKDYSRWAWISDRRVEIPPGETRTVEIKVLPHRDAEMDEYRMEVVSYSNTNRSVEMSGEMCFIVFRDYRLEAEEFKLDSESYQPGADVVSSLGVKNTGSRDFEEIFFTTKMYGTDEQILDNDTEIFSLEADERKVAETVNVLDKHHSPGTYTVEYELNARGNLYSSGEKEFEVEEAEEIDVSIEEESGFLYKDTNIILINEGNVFYAEDYTDTINLPYSYLISTDEERVEREGISTVYYWSTGIEPGEMKIISYRTHYWPLYMLAILFLVIFAKAYDYLRIPKIKKRVQKTETSDGSKIYTVSLEVKNRLAGRADKVIVKDFVPNIARVVEEFDALKPDVIKDDDGTELRWKLNSMDPGEERILHYKVRTLVEAVEYLKLPRANISGKMGRKQFESKTSQVKLKV